MTWQSEQTGACVARIAGIRSGAMSPHSNVWPFGARTPGLRSYLDQPSTERPQQAHFLPAYHLWRMVNTSVSRGAACTWHTQSCLQLARSGQREHERMQRGRSPKGTVSAPRRAATLTAAGAWFSGHVTTRWPRYRRNVRPISLRASTTKATTPTTKSRIVTTTGPLAEKPIPYRSAGHSCPARTLSQTIAFV